VVISTLFLTIFLLFTSIDTSGTWNVNRSATKTSTRNTFSALPGLKKKFGQKVVIRSYFLGYKLFVNFGHVFGIFTGHGFHLFKLIFYVVTSFVLLSEEKISKKKKKKSKNPKKQR